MHANPKKKLRATLEKGVPPVFVFKKNGLQCPQRNLLSKCFTANDDSQKKRKQDQVQSLEMNNDLRSHLLTRDRLLYEKKRNDLEKIQIDVPQKINDFAWQF